MPSKPHERTAAVPIDQRLRFEYLAGAAIQSELERQRGGFRLPPSEFDFPWFDELAQPKTVPCFDAPLVRRLSDRPAIVQQETVKCLYGEV